jgi:hypothetical protein
MRLNMHRKQESEKKTMAFPCDEYSEEYSEQPTVPLSSVELADEMRRQIERADRLQAERDRQRIYDPADPWPDLALMNILIRETPIPQPCPVCIYRRVFDGEIVQIPPEQPKLCDEHMHTLCGASPEDHVAMHRVYKHIYDWYMAPPEDVDDDAD